jgi:hypothetical protein
VDDAFQNHLTRIIDGLAEDIFIGLKLDKDASAKKRALPFYQLLLTLLHQQLLHLHLRL